MTTMLKWSPFQDLDSVERRMRRMFEEVGFAPTLLPAADIYETDDEFVVEVEVPGYEETELGIEVSNHRLTIKGAKEKKERAFRLHERLEREFERSFELPAEVDTKHVQAKFTKGVLEVHAPKLTVSKPQKIAIKAT
jgi:HSP20 family protein